MTLDTMFIIHQYIDANYLARLITHVKYQYIILPSPTMSFARKRRAHKNAYW